MEWKIDCLTQQRIVCATTAGLITLPTLCEMATQLLSVGEQHGFKMFLLDYRQSAPDIETLDIYKLPETLTKLGLTIEHRVASVFSPQNDRHGDFMFYDDLAFVNKLNHRLFTEPEVAINWLLSTSEPG